MVGGMSKTEREALIDELSGLHFALWRLHGRLERGSHRNCITVADDAIVSILRDLKELEPRLVAARGRENG